MDNTDTFIPSDVQKQLYPDAAAGLYLTNDSYYAGISITHIVRSVNKTENSVISTDRHYYLTGGYVATLNQNLKLYPSVLFKTDLQAPLQYDISSMLLIKETLWVGASYRNSFKKSNKTYVAGGTDNILTMLARITILEKYQVGYAYDYGRSALASSAGGTHEISFSAFLNVGKVRGSGSRCYF